MPLTKLVTLPAHIYLQSDDFNALLRGACRMLAVLVAVASRAGSTKTEADFR
jgi:hypothetical protein